MPVDEIELPAPYLQIGAGPFRQDLVLHAPKLKALYGVSVFSVYIIETVLMLRQPLGHAAIPQNPKIRKLPPLQPVACKQGSAVLVQLQGIESVLRHKGAVCTHHVYHLPAFLSVYRGQGISPEIKSIPPVRQGAKLFPTGGERKERGNDKYKAAQLFHRFFPCCKSFRRSFSFFQKFFFILSRRDVIINEDKIN